MLFHRIIIIPATILKDSQSKASFQGLDMDGVALNIKGGF